MDIIPATHLGSLIPLPTDTDLVAELLADKRSSRTRSEYEKDLKDFFQFVAKADPYPELVNEFLSLGQFEAIALVGRYKQHLYSRHLKVATVNRRLAAVKSLVNYARRIGRCSFTLADLKNDRVEKYRDTTGIPAEQFKTIVAQVELNTLRGKRDYAILRLLWENALRRGEISQLNVGDFELESRCLWVLGKGKEDKERITITPKTLQAIQDWLQERGEILSANKPLFITLDPRTYGQRLMPNAIYVRVRKLAEKAGISKIISPHRIRHSSITNALDKTNGDVRSVQKLSRHKNLNTLMIYDDNRRNVQGDISQLLSEDF
ncbi:tyrosine-type recombinase/integrase [Planktothrix sp.]|uniref:tyrosine-type recombinase/integrase n=2 Tax=Planktothrix sp. TaxID=3088171 RepID=UPI0038D37646